MDEPNTRGQDPDPSGTDGPPAGPAPAGAGPTERSSHTMVETCYRHPRVATGVHCTRCGRPICPDCMYPAPVGYQCPRCVAEARRTAPRRRWRIRFLVGRPGSVTTILLAANIGMFLVELGVGAAGGAFSGGSGLKLIDLGALYPPAIAFGHQYWRLITVMFLHASLLHLLLNMYALYLFGFLMESALGKVRYLVIYFLCGFLAGVASFVFSNPGVPAVGASGAIFGLLGAWVAYNYRRRGTALGAANLRWAGMLIALNLILGFSIASIDNFAHVGGLVAGAIAGWLAEGFGPRRVRGVVQVGGLLALVLIGIGLTAWRVATFPAISGI